MGNPVKNRAVRLPGSIQGPGGKGKLAGKTARSAGPARGTAYGASAGQEGAAPQPVTEGNQEPGGGQGAVGDAGGIRTGRAQGPDRRHPG